MDLRSEREEELHLSDTTGGNPYPPILSADFRQYLEHQRAIARLLRSNPELSAFILKLREVPEVARMLSHGDLHKWHQDKRHQDK